MWKGGMLSMLPLLTFSQFWKKRKGTTFVFIKEMQQNVISQGKIEFQQKFENDFVVVGKRKSTDLQKKTIHFDFF